MKEVELINQLTDYPSKLGEALRSYYRLKREAGRLEAQLGEESWSRGGPLAGKSKKSQEIEQQLAKVKEDLDTAEAAIGVLQARFEVNKILANAGLYSPRRRRQVRQTQPSSL